MRLLSIAVAMIALCASVASAPARRANLTVAGDLEDGRMQVFVVDARGQIATRWKTSTDPKSAWTAWSSFQTPRNGVTTLSVGYLSDKRMQLFATEPNGNIITCWKTSTDPNADWTPWTAFGQSPRSTTSKARPAIANAQPDVRVALTAIRPPMLRSPRAPNSSKPTMAPNRT
jgi:hypothetical protein